MALSWVSVTLLESLRIATDRASIASAFAAHAEPSDGWPPHRSDVRRFAEQLRREGDRYRAALVLVACLEDLGRYFEQPDDDSDGGWHRSEGKRWELWASDRRLRCLVPGIEHPPHRRVVERAIRELDASELEGWRLTALDEDDEPNEPLVALATTPLDPERLPIWIAEQLDATDDGELMDCIARFREATEDRREAGDGLVAARLALIGLVLASSFDEPHDDIAHSDERDAVLAEQLAVLDEALGAMKVARPEIRDELRAAIRNQPPAVGGRLRRLLGPEPAEAVADTARLKAQRQDAGEETKLEIDVQLVHELGGHLDDDTYLAICRDNGWTTSAMERLFAAGRVDEAVDEARRAFGGGDEGAPPWSLRDAARLLLQRGLTEPARALVEPWASFDVEHAELFARCLVAVDDDGAGKACEVWFSRRPTDATYRAIAQLLPPARFASVAPRLREALVERRQYLMALRIAVAEDDLDAIPELVEPLRDGEVVAARALLAPLAGQLPDAVRAWLEPVPSAPASRPTPADQASTEASPVAVGDRVAHAKFGEGVVVGVDGQGAERKLAIDFPDAGSKKLLERFVRRAR